MGAVQTLYSEEVSRNILVRISNGEPLTEICMDDGYPSQAEVLSWCFDVEGFAELYARARQLQAEVLADEILKLSNTPRLGVIKTLTEKPDGVQIKTVTADMVERTKLQIDARKWFASKVAPQKYGDRLAHQMLDEHGKPAKLEITVTRVEPPKP